MKSQTTRTELWVSLHRVRAVIEESYARLYQADEDAMLADHFESTLEDGEYDAERYDSIGLDDEMERIGRRITELKRVERSIMTMLSKEAER